MYVNYGAFSLYWQERGKFMVNPVHAVTVNLETLARSSHGESEGPYWSREVCIGRGQRFRSWSVACCTAHQAVRHNFIQV